MHPICKWLRVSLLCLVSLLSSTVMCAAALIISEYVEGSSFNKALEFYNGTGAAIDLAAESYAVDVYFNGNGSVGIQ